jgi:hypothetical protein
MSEKSSAAEPLGFVRWNGVPICRRLPVEPDKPQLPKPAPIPFAPRVSSRPPPHQRIQTDALAGWQAASSGQR